MDVAEDGQSAVILAALQVCAERYAANPRKSACICCVMLAVPLVQCRAGPPSPGLRVHSLDERCAQCCTHAVHLFGCQDVQQNQPVFRTPTEPANLQEDASLYEDAELVHVYKGTFTSEYTATRQTHGWKLTHNNVTF